MLSFNFSPKPSVPRLAGMGQLKRLQLLTALPGIVDAKVPQAPGTAGYEPQKKRSFWIDLLQLPWRIQEAAPASEFSMYTQVCSSGFHHPNEGDRDWLLATLHSSKSQSCSSLCATVQPRNKALGKLRLGTLHNELLPSFDVAFQLKCMRIKWETCLSAAHTVRV